MRYRDDDPPEEVEIPECCDREMDFDEVALKLKCPECGKVVAAQVDPDEDAIRIMFADTMQRGDSLKNRHTGATYVIQELNRCTGEPILEVKGEGIRLSITDIQNHWDLIKAI